MLDIAKALDREGLGARMIMQIHDELVFEVPVDEVERTSKLVRHAMEHVFPLVVPLRAEVGTGHSWSEAH